MITSVSNDKVKFARSLSRKKERAAAQQFLAEGTRLIQEASRAGMHPALVFYERSAMNRDAPLRQLVVALARHAREVHEVSAAVMRALCDTESPQGIAAVLPLPQIEIPAAPRLVLILDRIRDPGNLGTILRTAWAAGADAVLLAPETADALNPKVMRAGMGAQFHVPIAALEWQEIAQRTAHISRIYLASAEGTLSYVNADWTRPCALIVGGEAHGPSDAARRLATSTVAIPMPGHTESLNAAVAAGILLFAAARA